jgi:outer membrane protein OmpA-like peptidoglycan-associated protein
MNKRTLLGPVCLLFVTAPAWAQDGGGIRAYSKYDFVPGEQVITVYDFAQDAIGEFPQGWNTNASAEVVTIEGRPGRWLMFTGGGVFLPGVSGVLPDNFTFEFDLLPRTPFTAGPSFSTSFVELENVREMAGWHGANNRYTFTLHPDGVSQSERRQDGEGEAAVEVQMQPLGGRNGRVAHVAVWRTRERVRVYVDDQKVWDVSKAVVPTAQFNAIVFTVPDVSPEGQYFVTHVRLAVGAPDTRNRLITQGRWVTHGIRFDVNSDRIRGESYGTLKEVAGVLRENAELRVRIVGHTDSDGDDASNLVLSRRRAESVKAMLVSEFGIDAARMEADGRGESQPVASNDTATGKANNRRVEFVKL